MYFSLLEFGGQIGEDVYLSVFTVETDITESRSLLLIERNSFHINLEILFLKFRFQREF